MFALWSLRPKSSNKTILFILIFTCMIFGINSFTPDGRAGHVTVIVKNQIYFMGGSREISDGDPRKSSIRGYNLSDEVFTLDLMSQFSTVNPPYVELPGTSKMIYGSAKGTAVVGGPSQEDVYLVEGAFQNLTLLNQIDHNATITSNQTLMVNELINTWNVTNQTIFIYRPSTKSWLSFESVAKGGPTIRRRSTSTIIDQDRRIIYIFGGRAELDTGSLTFICFNDLYTYDTAVSKWNKINAANAPSPQSHSTATLLPNGKILYIGGVYQISPGEDALPIDMTNISVFDTNSLTWSYKIAKSSNPIQARTGHTATLTPDNNKIIIIGGTSSYALSLTTAYPTFLSLDISTEPYEYSELSNITNDETGSINTNPYIYLLEMPCQNWVTIFRPGESSCPQPPVTLIICLTIACYVVFVASIVVFIVTRRLPLTNKLIIYVTIACSIVLIAAIITDTELINPPRQIVNVIIGVTIVFFFVVIIAEMVFLCRRGRKG
ncbi:9394_t:CDS:2 [Dentiscutata heterogama]|uniref:9394_t:CDS:1 n=1 Tax=Dentiscutata heterogama TaxID=1316150 RepID=A0ACA9LA08_9GLOM|nr:9394_t:CDS:2 [Dentiscutata heterogama]